MDINFTNLLPVAVIVIIYGVTWAIRKFIVKADGTVPNWLILVPLSLGFVLGVMEYYTMTDSTMLQGGTWWKHLMTALFRGFTYGGAAVLLWELRKKYLPFPEETNGKAPLPIPEEPKP